MRSQSAMEYLMTYGWAILIIAIILVALFSLNLFNSYTFAPKAPPGACQVLRPSGPGSNVFVTMEGGSNCNGVIPEYVGGFNNSISVTLNQLHYTHEINSSGTSGVTIVAWSSSQNNLDSYTMVELGSPDPSLQLGDDVHCGFGSKAGGLIIVYYSSSSYSDNCMYEVAQNSMEFYAFTFNGVVGRGYQSYDGKLYNASFTASMGSNSIVSDPLITMGGSGGGPFYMSNVQIYNTSLSNSSIQALYQEGIGGAPIDLQNLVGWWPLDGNANDYSGNGNNGAATNVKYVSNWESGYSAP